MRGKAIGLILLVVFAVAATSFALRIITNQPPVQNVDFVGPHHVALVDDNQTGVAPNGLEIDSPGMPH